VTKKTTVDIATKGRITAGPALKFDKLGRPYIEIKLALDWVDDLPLFMQQSTADQAINFATKNVQPVLFESP